MYTVEKTKKMKPKSFRRFFAVLLNNSSGVTYIELMITTVIIAAITLLGLASYRGGEERDRIIYTVHQVAQDIQRMQALSLAGRKPTSGSERPCGYGIRFIKGASANSYVLFREMPTGTDCSNAGTRNKQYDAGEEIENGIVRFPSQVYVVNLHRQGSTFYNNYNIFFTTPFARNFGGENGAIVEGTEDINIVIGNSTFTKTVSAANDGEALKTVVN